MFDCFVKVCFYFYFYKNCFNFCYYLILLNMRNLLYNTILLLKSMIKYKKVDFSNIGLIVENSTICDKSRVTSPADIRNVSIDSYSYISKNANVSFTKIGKFTSIGPNFSCGFGIHPLNCISSSPMFYSKDGIKGYSFADVDSFEMRKNIVIGNDVFIGSNVTIIDGVIIGDGAVIGAGAVVTKDVPPYAIAVGVPAKIIKYRFEKEIIDKLIETQWWNWNDKKLFEITEDFFDVNLFLKKNI